MSRREIEDVLSSIKRLVSQDIHDRSVRPDLREKLILTSELRVDTVQDVEPVAPEVRRPEAPLPEDHHALLSVPPQQSEWQEPAPACCGTPLTAEPTAGAKAAPNASMSLLQRITRSQAQGTTAAPIPNQEAAEPAPPVNASEACAQPTRTRLHFTEPSPAPENLPRPEPKTAPQVSSGPEPDLDERDIEVTLARLEAILSGKPVPDEPLVARVAAPAPAAPAAAEPAQEPAANPEPEPRPESVRAAHADPFADGSEVILDEDMLFRLVADIVRLELQGELGEKITRNIRKLVRSEVARELQLRRDQGWNV
ncbi:MAG: hypothetical protein EA339_12445 [Rhodobacteraceae bacterium]|nr:MAG: hypothetical protein EA339_12445 [Paracoccaceae bacterium]